jgi:hypothetical protein
VQNGLSPPKYERRHNPCHRKVRRETGVITARELAQSPAWFPVELALPGSVRLVHLDEATYRAASFLDRRILPANTQAMCDLEMLRSAAAGLAPRSHYIFHTGHVGSTLISRLVGEHERFFSLREPALLREIESSEPRSSGAPGLEVLLPILARTWRPEQRAVIKATSFVSELARLILSNSDHAAALFLFAQPLAYLRTILAGANSRIEARTLAPSRLQRLARRLGAGDWQVALRSEGEYIAMSWLSEMAALHDAVSVGPVLWMDFDHFLARPASSLEEIFRTLGATATASEIEALLSGPLMRKYSKAPEYAYDAELRRKVLAAADRQFGTEIRRGMEWLHSVAARHGLAATVLQAVRS